MRLRLLHRTRYTYSQPVSESHNELRLQPRQTPHQAVLSSLVSVTPAARLRAYTDLNHNHVHYFELPDPHGRLTIESRAVVETRNPVDFDNLPYGFPLADLPALHRSEECHPFLGSSSYVELHPDVWRQAVDIRNGSQDTFQTAYAVMQFIFENFTYDPGTTGVSTHANHVIAQRSGVCQDFAHAMVAYCRSLGIPARYVSGYFFDATRDHHLRGSEASHAWVEVFLPDHGWIGLDPTNNKVVDATYIVTATGRDYRDVAPVAGTYYGTAHSQLDVSVSVRRLDTAATAAPTAR